MSRTVSVPEKTLEHWASQYLTYRYKTNVALWWPSRGEDIDISWFPSGPGKAIQIELKTTVPGSGWHDVQVDLGQLWEYCQRPVGLRPFYAFPWPNWDGRLTDAASAAGRSVTESAFSRSARWWFAEWMVVLTADQVAQVLQKQLAAHDRAERGEKAGLVRFEWGKKESARFAPIDRWGSGVAPPDVIGWRDFWAEIETCGRDGWPQLIRLPQRLVGARPVLDRTAAASLLRDAAYRIRSREWDVRGPIVTMEPDMQGNYRVVDGPVFAGSEPPQGDARDDDEHLQVVFLGAAAMFRSGR